MNNVLIDSIKTARSASTDMHLTIPLNVFQTVIDMVSMFHPDQLVHEFIASSYVHWDTIREVSTATDDRIIAIVNETLKLQTFFPEHIDQFKRLFSPAMPVVYQEQLLNYLRQCILITLQTVHRGRMPYLKNGRPTYGKDFYPIVKLQYHVSKLGLTLNF